MIDRFLLTSVITEFVVDYTVLSEKKKVASFNNSSKVDPVEDSKY